MNLLATRFSCLALFVQFFIASGFSEEDNSMATISSEETVISTCRLQIKINPLQSATVSSAPKAIVLVSLVNGEGDPISGGHIELSATAGTLLCSSDTLPDSSSTKNDSDPRSCFSTGDDGKAQIDLINLPFNTPVRVKASYNYGDYTVKATGSVVISKKTIHKK